MAVTLRDFMTTGEVLTISPAATLAEAAERMQSRGVGAAVVVDGGAIVGIFTERDLLRAIAGGGRAEEQLIESHMTSDPVTLPSDHSPSEAARIMTDRKFRHIPVVDGGELVGIVSIRDLVAAELQLPSESAHVGTDFP
jgi:CBS domain-containing protein